MSATSALLRGEPFQARTAYLDALARCRSIGDVRGEIITSTGLARATASLGNRAEAVELAEQAARLAREHDDPDAEKFALNVLAQLAGSGGDTELFHRLRADMVRLWALVRQPRRTANWLPSGMAGPSRRRTDRGDWLGLLGHALADLDRPEQARACWQQAIATLSGLAHPATEELRTLVRFG
jgi:tetratricopeptide (TPR) repeat protein